MPDSAPVNPQRQLRQIAEDLGLEASGHEQDWGIELSDPRRVSEFLDYCDARSELWLPWVRRAYADLVLQSANEALEAGDAVPEDRLRRFAADLATRFPEALLYWTSLRPADADPWPVQRLAVLDAHLDTSDTHPDIVKVLVEQANRLLDSSPSHTDVADLRAGLEALPPRELVRFDGQSRSWLSGLSSKSIAQLRWPLLRGGRKALWSVLGLVSGDGRERERAAKAAELTPLTARLLAIRCTDWVAEVRDAASERLQQCPVPLLIEALALADQLATERLRGDALDALLDTRLSDEDLRVAIRADDRHIRRAAWRRLVSRGAPDFEELRDVAAADEDVVVRGVAAAALDALPAEQQRTLASMLVADPVGSVATPALAVLVSLDGTAAIERALTGPSAAVRRAARDWAAIRGVDARAVYLAQLRERPRDRVALTALADLGDAQDAGLFNEMLSDERPRVRAAGLRALARVDQATARDAAVDALRASASGRVMRAAADVLREGSLSSVELDAVVALAIDQSRGAGQRLRAVALLRRNRWQHIAVVLEARAAGGDEAFLARLDQEVAAWIVASRRTGRGPDSALRGRIERLLNTLRPESRREIEFVLRTTTSG